MLKQNISPFLEEVLKPRDNKEKDTWIITERDKCTKDSFQDLNSQQRACYWSNTFTLSSKVYVSHSIIIQLFLLNQQDLTQ